MNKSQIGDNVGDFQAKAMMPHSVGLRASEDLGARLRAEPAPKAVQSAPIGDVAHSLKLAQTKVPTCKQTLWLSFYFDGIGNNLEADARSIATWQNSIVYMLRTIHKKAYIDFIFRASEYFKDVGDPGGTDLGLGAGRMGRERLEWALERFDERNCPHIRSAQNPSIAITEVNVAAFGFCRGAVLARAFITAFPIYWTKGENLRIKYQMPLIVDSGTTQDKEDESVKSAMKLTRGPEYPGKRNHVS
jgi:hypothetical protein